VKTLIIAEKPSLARSVMAGIGSRNFARKDGYYESSEYIVSYAYGHLFALVPLEDYLPKDRAKKGWTLDVLPFFPGDGREEDYRFELLRSSGGKGKSPDAGAKQQFGILKKLMNRSDVDRIVNCGDADREGEVIIRLIILKGLKKKKDIYRLWLPDQTPETVRAELAHMKPDSEYDALFHEGMCRTLMDWMYGINLSRYVTLKAPGRDVYAVGRVLTPIVKAVADRDLEIRNFVPKIYVQVESVTEVNGKKIRLTVPKKYEPEEKLIAHDLCARLNEADAVVTGISRKISKKKRSRLFSLSKLQALLGKKYKMPMKASLAAVQSLYEKGYVSYPRTNTEYLAESEKDKIAAVIARIRESYDAPIAFRDTKEIFDDSKIESHSALTPTGKRPEQLSEKEAMVFQEILNRFCAVFCEEDCIVEKTEVTVSCAGETFHLKGEVLRQEGFLKFDPQPIRNELPIFCEGDSIPHHFRLVQKETNPPKHYTTETLTEFLKHPFRKRKDPEDENAETADGCEGTGDTPADGNRENGETAAADYEDIRKGTELGTEATRTAIISKAIGYGYISQMGDQYMIEEKGLKVLKYLAALKVDMSLETSVAMQVSLKRVYDGSATVNEVLKETEERIRRDFGM